MRLVRICLEVILLVIGAILGDGYKNILYLYWLATSAGLIIYSEFITSTLLEKNDQLEKYKNKVSILTILKSNGGSVVQMSLFPHNKVIVTHTVEVDLFVTFAIPITVVPDIKIITDSRWDIMVSNAHQFSRNYAGKYEYVLHNLTVTKIDDKFFKFSFSIKINNAGNHNFTVKLDNGSVKGKMENVLVVHPA